jgi:spermidine/putrescine transport system permease protein
MMLAFANTLVGAVAVALMSVLVGTAAAILINSVSGKRADRALRDDDLDHPDPRRVIGISTMIMWTKLGGVLFGPDGKPWPFIPGLHLSVLGQVSYIAAMVMLLGAGAVAKL